jgi:coenzyme F420-reducing hydrogenase alpha subunit
MSKGYPEAVKKGLRLKKAGNEIIRLLGGREIHPINVKIGGFYSIPPKERFKKLEEHLKQARDDAKETVKWVSGFDFPHLERPYEFVSLSHPKEYPMALGKIISSSRLNIEAREYDHHFKEYQVPYSNALQSTLNDKSYLAGPTARYNLNHEHLSPFVQETIKEIGFEKKCLNPFRSIIVRALEVLYACDESLRIIGEGKWDGLPAAVEGEKRKAIGYGATEAPRGLLYHRYEINEKGLIESAKIVPPTSQNQKSIEEDLRDFVSQNMALPDQELVWKCEQTIRNYDPCISCSAHFLKLKRH